MRVLVVNAGSCSLKPFHDTGMGSSMWNRKGRRVPAPQSLPPSANTRNVPSSETAAHRARLAQGAYAAEAAVARARGTGPTADLGLRDRCGCGRGLRGGDGQSVGGGDDVASGCRLTWRGTHGGPATEATPRPGEIIAAHVADTGAAVFGCGGVASAAFDGRRLADVSEGPRVLVAYATEHGSTRGVAERIATRLAEAGAQVDARPVDDVDDLAGYDAVVLGSGVYNQSWIPGATEFLRASRAALAARPVWLFSVGSFGDTHRGIGRLMRREPREIGEFQDAIHPREYRVFADAIQRHQWPLPSRLFFRAFGGRFGDNRDWPEIDGWAQSMARTLKSS